MRDFWILARLLVFILLVTGCTAQAPRHQPPPAGAAEPAGLAALLADQHRQWRGTPYRLGGMDRRGIDCSAFVQRTFSDRLGVSLPRTTAAQHRQGQPVRRDELRLGDLVFFKTSAKVRHVGIYLGEGRFLHASTSVGVTVSHLDNSYWRRHYWKARRVLQ